MPPFLPETSRQLEEVVPEAGSSVRNPVEGPRGYSAAADFYANGLKMVNADPQIDFILARLAVDVYGGRQPDLKEQLMKTAEALVSTAQTLTKPIAVVLYAGEHLETIAAVLEAREELQKAGIPVFPTIEAAAKAVSKLIKYHEFAQRDKPAG